MNKEVKCLIIDQKGNIIPFDTSDINLSVKEIVSNNIKDAKRYTTKKMFIWLFKKFFKRR